MMNSSDYIALVAAGLSGLSLIVSIWAAYRASKISHFQLRLSNRAELHSMYLELDREMLHDPMLHSMFKSSATYSEAPPTAIELDKQTSFVSMYLNVYELAFAQFIEIKGLTAKEKQISKTWNFWIKSFFDDCIRARDVWGKYRLTYYSAFRDHIDDLIDWKAEDTQAAEAL